MKLKTNSEMKKYIVLLLAMFTLFSCKNQDEGIDNYVILVSFDAFRWDYPALSDTPTFDKIQKEGVRAERVISSFPTKTFPNHYSIATGLYPDNHGLVNNSFWAPDLEKFYRIGNRDMVQNPDFYGGEPIWNTAEKQGIRSASFFWVGSEAPIQGMHPSYWKIYDGSVPFNDRVDTVLHWLQLPIEKRPGLVLLYFQEPDGVGHDFGPFGEETGEMIRELEQELARLRDGIKDLPIADKVNLIVTSDHGMGQTSEDRYVNIYDHVKEEWVENLAGWNPMYLLDAADDYIDSVVNILDAVEGLTAWRKEDIPAHLHYGTHERITNVVVVADSSWSVGIEEVDSDYNGGTHGYDNSNSDMHNVFYAEGPAFKSGYKMGAFENVNIYPLITHILDLDPAPIDGDLDIVKDMLK